jgi:hypothetical protein
VDSGLHYGEIFTRMIWPSARRDYRHVRSCCSQKGTGRALNQHLSTLGNHWNAVVLHGRHLAVGYELLHYSGIFIYLQYRDFMTQAFVAAKGATIVPPHFFTELLLGHV